MERCTCRRAFFAPIQHENLKGKREERESGLEGTRSQTHCIVLR